jgi:hypothetical protein
MHPFLAGEPEWRIERLEWNLLAQALSWSSLLFFFVLSPAAIRQENYSVSRPAKYFYDTPG